MKDSYWFDLRANFSLFEAHKEIVSLKSDNTEHESFSQKHAVLMQANMQLSTPILVNISVLVPIQSSFSCKTYVCDIRAGKNYFL